MSEVILAGGVSLIVSGLAGGLIVWKNYASKCDIEELRKALATVAADVAEIKGYILGKNNVKLH